MELGLGLIGIGRTWGFKTRPIPTTEQTNRLLDTALRLGIWYFDTAPSYGVSEERLGNFLKNVDASQRQHLQIATKFGEHWDEDTNAAYVDHSYEALCKSIDQSRKRLPKIDILQLHKATTKTAGDEGVRGAMEYARSRGILTFGASVGDIDTARMVMEDPAFSSIQIPFNQDRMELQEVFALAERSGKLLIINRPFGEGRLVYDDKGGLKGEESAVSAFRMIMAQGSHAVVLSGTSSSEHLLQNMEAFNKAKELASTE